MNSPPADLNLVFDAAALRERVMSVLSRRCGLETLSRDADCSGVRTSSVLLLLGETVPEEGGIPEVCIILNKRSKEVKQPGDLCCPGGAIEKFDRFLSRLLSFQRFVSFKVALLGRTENRATRKCAIPLTALCGRPPGELGRNAPQSFRADFPGAASLTVSHSLSPGNPSAGSMGFIPERVHFELGSRKNRTVSPARASQPS